VSLSQSVGDESVEVEPRGVEVQAGGGGGLSGAAGSTGSAQHGEDVGAAAIDRIVRARVGQGRRHRSWPPAVALWAGRFSV
jgi:hypothetical protein